MNEGIRRAVALMEATMLNCPHDFGTEEWQAWGRVIDAAGPKIIAEAAAVIEPKPVPLTHEEIMGREWKLVYPKWTVYCRPEAWRVRAGDIEYLLEDGWHTREWFEKRRDG